MNRIGIVEQITPISKEEFYLKYLLHNKPVIIKDIVKHWRAYKLWSADYLVKKIGQIKVSYYNSQSNLHPDLSNFENKTANTTSFFQEGTLSSLLLKSSKFNFFLAGDELSLFDKEKKRNELDILSQDFEIPSLFDANELHSGGLWISPKHVISWLHYDQNGCYNLNAQIKGSKRVLLFPPFHVQNYYLNLYSENNRSNFSRVNITSPDYSQFPLYKNVVYYEGELNEGDILFIPAYWLHSFEHLSDLNINLNFWWDDNEFSKLSNPLLVRKIFFDSLKKALQKEIKQPLLSLLKEQGSVFQSIVRNIELQILSA